MNLHQINGDGAGPMKCSVDPTAAGDNFEDMTITTNVPGNNGKSNAKNADFPLVAKMPDGVSCTGTVAGVKNVCMVKCQNPAGPFGGTVAVQTGGAGTADSGTADSGTAGSGTADSGTTDSGTNSTATTGADNGTGSGAAGSKNGTDTGAAGATGATKSSDGTEGKTGKKEHKKGGHKKGHKKEGQDGKKDKAGNPVRARTLLFGWREE